MCSILSCRGRRRALPLLEDRTNARAVGARDCPPLPQKKDAPFLCSSPVFGGVGFIANAHPSHPSPTAAKAQQAGLLVCVYMFRGRAAAVVCKESEDLNKSEHTHAQLSHTKKNYQLARVGRRRNDPNCNFGEGVGCTYLQASLCSHPADSSTRA